MSTTKSNNTPDKSREERLAKNLRDNLKRRKMASRKQNNSTVTDAPESP